MIESRDHNGYTLTYGFDKNGNRTNIVYPGGLSLSYDYNPNGVMTGATDWAGRHMAYAYDLAGRMTNMVYPNGVQAAYDHDAAGRIVEYQYTHGTSIIHRTIERNAVGFKQREDILAGLEPFPTTPIVSSRDHDAADRLLDNEMQPTPDDPVNTTETYAFDNNGNLVQRSEDGGQTTAYVWDHENRLSQMTEDGGQTTEFVYNGNGDRTARIVDGVTNHYILDAAASLHNVLIETDTNGVPQRYYLFGARGLYAQIESDGSTFYTHADELGSTLALTDAAGNPVRQYAYSPYGEIINQTGVIDTPYTYIGAYGVYREAAHSGLYHMKARYYHAGLKRFLSKDPIGLEGGVNWYLYANGNPVGFVDWWGLCAESGGLSLFDRVMNTWDRWGAQNALSEANYEQSVQNWYASDDYRQYAQTPVHKTAVFLQDMDEAIGDKLMVASLVAGGVRMSAPRVTVNNAIPSRMARVVPDTPITRASRTLGRPGVSDVFVTAADDIAGLNARQISGRLTIPQSPTGYRIIEFRTPSSGVASPILRTDPGFIGGGRTFGGAREFVIPNSSIPAGATTTVVGP